MNDLKLILYYEFKMKIREMKSMIKNLFMGLLIISVISIFMVFQFSKLMFLNLEKIYLYKDQIFLSISMVVFIFTITQKKPPLVWHPASMIHLSGCKFYKIFKFSMFKKIISHLFLSVFIALILNRFKMSFLTIQTFLSFWNVLTISLIGRYFIYNKGLSIQIVVSILMYIMVLNFQFYINKYLSFILILYLTCISIHRMTKVLNIDINFDKSFNDMVFINRANYLARGNIVEDRQEFVREISAEKYRNNFMLRKLKFKNPLIQKNLITFSRINLFVSFYIFTIFIVVIILYKYEFFEFVKIIKKLDMGEPILSFHQALFINNIMDLMVEQKNLLIEKSKRGLYLPYNKYEINKSFIILGVPLLLIATFIVGVFLQKSVLIILTIFLLYLTIFYIYLIFEKKRKKDLAETIIQFIIFIISYLFIKL